MSDAARGPTLTDSEGMGGVIAQAGFDYQLWDGLERLPGWLRNPAFEQMIFEGLQDLEARFFAPHAPQGRLLERFQAKSGTLSRNDVVDVLESFRRFDETHPSVARVQTLVTPQLPPTLKWMARDTERVRRARPFYAPFAKVAEASAGKLREDLVKEFGEPLGTFVADSVEVSERPIPNRELAHHAFTAALSRAFPELDVSPKRSERAFEDLSGLARRSMGRPLGRAALLDVLEASLGTALENRHRITLHVRSDRREANERTVEIDASSFSGSGGQFPEAGEWAAGLLTPLERASRWLTNRGASRIAVEGSYRLTTGFALGWSLRSALGFELEIATRDGPWATDVRPRGDDSSSSWRITQAEELKTGRLIVCVGVIRDPAVDLVARGAVSPQRLLAALHPGPLTSATAVQAGVSVVKAAVATAVSRLRPSVIDLYYAGPGAFAVALGHRWNALPSTQLHEFIPRTGHYVPTAILSAVPSPSRNGL